MPPQAVNILSGSGGRNGAQGVPFTWILPNSVILRPLFRLLARGLQK
jgi:hypothetical protein